MHSRWTALFLFSFLLVVFSCKKDDIPTDGTITIRMERRVGSKAFELNKMIYLSPVGHPYEILNLKYYISEIKLHNSDGNSIVFFDEGHLTNVKDPGSWSFNLNIPAGRYDKLSFTYGFTKDKNIVSYLPNTVANQNMLWPERLGPGGYHYMQYEGRYDSLGTGNVKSFNLHTGPTNGTDNSFVVELPLGDEININGNAWELELIMDMQEWLQNPTVYDYEKYGQAIMAQQSAQNVLKDNGQSVFQLGDLKEL